MKMIFRVHRFLLLRLEIFRDLWRATLRRRHLSQSGDDGTSSSIFVKIPTLIFGLLIFAGCAPSVKLTTPEPLQVDIHMQLDVNQRQVSEAASATMSEEESKALRRRDDRSGEVWGMKNDGVVVESARGYLESVGKSGWDPAYVQRLVGEENQDRRILYEGQAKSSSRPIASIEAEAGHRLRQQAYVNGTTNAAPSKASPVTH